ncbi:MAG TPA: hypothetical protein VE570_11855 [Thermoleophilaceae bacterium]|nr:hypothetical protein [Thermoleophilaceae bacterium]
MARDEAAQVVAAHGPESSLDLFRYACNACPLDDDEGPFQKEGLA